MKKMQRRNLTTNKAPNIRNIKNESKKNKSIHITLEKHNFLNKEVLKRKLAGEEISIRSLVDKILTEYIENNESFE